jgi:hypothetical protein
MDFTIEILFVLFYIIINLQVEITICKFYYILTIMKRRKREITLETTTTKSDPYPESIIFDDYKNLAEIVYCYPLRTPVFRNPEKDVDTTETISKSFVLALNDVYNITSNITKLLFLPKYTKEQLIIKKNQ